MNSIVQPRHPWSAALLSLLVPGLGHLYAGDARAAVRTFVLYHLAAGLMFATVFMSFLGPLAAVFPVVLPIATWVTVAVLAARRAARAPNPYTLHPFNRWYWYVVTILVAAFVWQPAVFKVMTSRCVQAFRVPSAAMEPTLLVGDFIFVSKLAAARRPPARDDVVMFAAPAS